MNIEFLLLWIFLRTLLMKQSYINRLHLWQFESFQKESAVRHFVTDRNSNGDGHEFTLSYSSHPDQTFIQQNRHMLAQAFELDDSQLFLPQQVHQTKIINVKNNTTTEELKETDALISNEKNLCIAVMSADCVTILLYDKKNKAIGAVHSGWRGTVAHILKKTLHEMSKVFGTEGKDILAGIGPSVCQDSYEVGEEVIEQFNQSYGPNHNLLIPTSNQKARLDLWQANKIQLLEFGVPHTHIELANLCTVKSNQYFYSARKGDSGRFAAGIMLTKLDI